MVLTRNEWFRNMRRNMGIYSRPLRTNVALRYLGALFCAISLHRCRTKSLEMKKNVSIFTLKHEDSQNNNRQH